MYDFRLNFECRNWEKFVDLKGAKAGNMYSSQCFHRHNSIVKRPPGDE